MASSTSNSEAGPSRSPSAGLIHQAKLIKQGAEAKIYILPSIWQSPTPYPAPDHRPVASGSGGPSVILKHRFPKTYRHPTLNASLTRSRIAFEARALARCLRAGVRVPGVMFVDEKEGVLGLEWIEGWSVREVLGGGAEGELEEQDEEEEEVGVESEGARALEAVGVTQEQLMQSIGSALARLHLTTIIHGDLTTSNMMVRLTPSSSEPYEIVLIDFGLSSTASLPEHYAVDLYVLERAFASTHPASELLYAGVLEAYARGLGEKKWKPIEQKLKEVRRRGRKRDMTG